MGTGTGGRLIAGLRAAACIAAAVSAGDGLRHALLFQSAHAGPAMIVSAAVSSLLGCLFLVAAASDAMGVVRWGGTAGRDPKPSARMTPAVALGLLALSALVIRSEQAGSFVNWDETRGLPLAWLLTARYYGPCVRLQQVCRLVSFDGLLPVPLLIDAVWAAVIAVPLVRVHGRLLRRLRRSPLD
jgi:hypothetical protein